MFEKDYNKWLDEKNKIENFEKISESNKKAIYEAEQELTDNEEVNLYKVEYIPADEEYEEAFVYYFAWVGYHKELERVAKEENCRIEQIEDIVNIGGTMSMNETLRSYIHLGENDEIEM